MDELSPPEWMDEGPPPGADDAPVVGKASASNMLGFHLSDMGNAGRLVALHGTALRHVSSIGWHYWAGTHWEVDRLNRVQEAAKHTIAEFRAAAERFFAKAEGDDQKAIGKAICKFAGQSENAGRIANMITLASSDPLVSRTPDDLDAHPYLLNVANGTIDLRTGALRPHSRDDMLTICAPASLRPWAELPTQSVLGAFLQSVQPDLETQAFLWRCIGMSLIGEQRDHVVLFAYGEGGNGKGTWFRMAKAALGKYFCAIPSDMLIEKQNKAHAAQTAQLMGKRLVVADELPTGRSFDAAEVKRLSGGDDIPAQFMRQNWFNFKPSHTLWLQGNDKPHTSAGDYGMWRRMKLIAWNTKVVAVDNDLDAKLDAERDIVLRMAVDGAVEYLRAGLGCCAEVEAATKAYKDDEDSIGQFIAECCDRGEAYKCPRPSLRAAIDRWWKDEGKMKAPSNQTLKNDFAKRGIVAGRAHGQAWHWVGIRLNDETSRQVAQTEDRWRYQ
jgi:putative DNA primase/helicase